MQEEKRRGLLEVVAEQMDSVGRGAKWVDQQAVEKLVGRRSQTAQVVADGNTSHRCIEFRIGSASHKA